MAKHNRIAAVAAGVLVLWGAIEGLGHLLGDLNRAVPGAVTAIVVIAFGLLLERILFGRAPAAALRRLGFGKPTADSLVRAAVVSALLFASIPLVARISGQPFSTPSGWLGITVGLFAVHGIAEELAFRGFLFAHLRERWSFWRAAWYSVPFFAAAHVPMMVTQGLVVGGMALLLSIVISFPLAFLFERGNNTLWAPALVHAAVDVIIPLSVHSPVTPGRPAALGLWMAASMIVPYVAFYGAVIGGKDRSPASSERITQTSTG